MDRKALKYDLKTVSIWHKNYLNNTLSDLEISTPKALWWFKKYKLYVKPSGFQKHNFRGLYGVTNNIKLEQLYAWFYVNAYQRRAKRKKLEFTLPLNEFIKIVTSSCTYCGISSSSETRKVNTHTVHMLTVDRIDPKKGYIEGNCVAACKKCNTIKMDMTLDEFTNQIKTIASHLRL
jgi:5-methylcytosine-specific restriction endonuclease McrA